MRGRKLRGAGGDGGEGGEDYQARCQDKGQVMGVGRRRTVHLDNEDVVEGGGSELCAVFYVVNKASTDLFPINIPPCASPL